MRTKLDRAEPSRVLPEDANTAEYLKYKLCEKFVLYILEKNITQAALARQLGMDPARLNEMVKYRIDLFTVDKLLEFAELSGPKIKIDVALKGISDSKRQEPK
jgi:predicted XRE-type DNA-binding protein